MNWIHYISYFFGGIFFANTIPHLVSGMMGQAFQSPFAKPPGKGLSSSTVNVIWGALNLALSYILLVRVGSFDIRDTIHVVTAGTGALLISLLSARHFGHFHGGNTSRET